MTQLNRTALTSRLDAVYEDVLDRLRELVAIPSLAWPTADPAHVDATAAAVARMAEPLGFDSVEILRAENPDGTPGFPAVVASRQAPAGRPTVVLYAHHDVQPAGDLEAWETPPFEATIRGDRMYGRGSADDKAGILVHLTALQLLGDELGVGVVLFIEGEEEIGSPSFRSFLETYRDKLSGDAIIVADSSNLACGTPALTTSLRGMAGLEFTVRTLSHSVHSGMYGGAVPDATLAMTKLLASLHDDAGQVAVAGLHSAPEAAAEYGDEPLGTDTVALAGTELIGRGSIASRLWHQPSITVIGIDTPNVDDSSNTLLASVRAKISIRLAPGEKPAEALAAVKAHLQEHVPFGAELEFGPEESGAPWSADAADPVIATALDALSEGFGVDAVQMGLGGSIPFIADLVEVFPSASILVTGIEDPDTRAHSPNESLYLPDFRSAIISEALLLDRLARY